MPYEFGAALTNVSGSKVTRIIAGENIRQMDAVYVPERGSNDRWMLVDSRDYSAFHERNCGVALHDALAGELITVITANNQGTFTHGLLDVVPHRPIIASRRPGQMQDFDDYRPGDHLLVIMFPTSPTEAIIKPYYFGVMKRTS